jgi:N-acetylmuramoyl-L-alanine amidase
MRDINSHSIGIEIANKGHEWGYEAFNNAQIESVMTLAKRLNLPHILAHSDVAPSRKQDPGEKFPWHMLAQHGLGQYAPPAPFEAGAAYQFNDEGVPIQALQLLFSRLGYGLPLTGVYDAETKDVVTAFQRHWRQEKVDGIADVSTVKTLRGVLSSQIKPDRTSA